MRTLEQAGKKCKSGESSPKGACQPLENTWFVPPKYRVYPISLPHSLAVSSWLINCFRRCEQVHIFQDIPESVRND